MPSLLYINAHMNSWSEVSGGSFEIHCKLVGYGWSVNMSHELA